MDYEDFIASKAASRRFEGIESTDLPSVMFPFQRDLTKWALRRGRAAIFAGTGLGKSLMELAWAREIPKLGRVILVAPLAVAEQMIGESNKFDIPATYTRRGERCRSPITITNYELLRHFVLFCGCHRMPPQLMLVFFPLPSCWQSLLPSKALRNHPMEFL